MVLGIERINAQRQQPNSRIVFIKPLPGPTEAFAQDFLERVAAICHPIMKANHLSVMSLEEYEPNPEFIGRNFNAGEVIQLVLKAPYTGHWISFRSVVMVMMHELAHCKQMNHSGSFWRVRNQFAGEMKDLWSKGYTGDGFWSRGKTLLSGQYEPVRSARAEAVPRSLCGGTFRSTQGRKRKRKVEGSPVKQTLSYAERQQRRIAKKFGTKGVTLGDDEDTRVKLENGKRPKGKPRVAGSARGRELRAAAALARFGGQQEGPVKNEQAGSGSDTDSDYEDVNMKTELATDLDESRLVDSKGNGMVKVCEDEDGDDVHVKQEMQELQDVDDIALASGQAKVSNTNEGGPSNVSKHDNYNTRGQGGLEIRGAKTLPSESDNPVNRVNDKQGPSVFRLSGRIDVSCPICSMKNACSTTLCVACSHVLEPHSMPGHWQCSSTTCLESLYINSADSGLCGVCGSRKPYG